MKYLFEDPANTKIAIEQLRSGDDQLFLEVYQLYRAEFIRWGMRHHQLNEQDLEDVFQDAVIVLFKKLDQIDPAGSIVGYLKKIFNYKLLHKYRDTHRIELQEQPSEAKAEYTDNDLYQKTKNDHLKHLFQLALNSIGEPCYSILKLKFYENFDGQSIADRLGYKNATVIHTKTNICIKQLRKLVMDKI